MDIEKEEQKKLDILMSMDKPESFGASFLQRNFKIGYNYSMHVLERGVNNGVLMKVKDTYQYMVAPKSQDKQ